MDGDPGQIIRSLRLALDMSQTEFARAAGWAPSTISSWERGRAKPSRLAFKTILAFAEERGVRYRPRSATNALVPMLSAPGGSHAEGATSRGPRPALRPLVYPERDARGDRLEELRRAFEDARPQGTPPGLTVGPGPASAQPRWSAEASFRLTLGAGRDRARHGLPRGVLEAAVVVAAFCAALALRAPLRALLARPSTVRPVPAAAVAAAPAEAPVLPSTVSLRNTTGVRASAPATQVGSVPAASSADPVDAPPALVATARLESVMAIGAAARATFRTANDAVTVVTGEWLGAQQVTAITPEGVTLVDRAGVSHRVRVGQHTPFE